MAKQVTGRFSRAFAAGFLLLAGTGVVGAEFSAAQLEHFEKRVRPVLIEHCAQCHSRTADKVKAGLVLDYRSDLLTGGDSGPVIVPGKPEESLLVEAIGYENVDLQMPPKTRLSPAQLEDISQWIAEGAAWPKEDAPTEKAGAKGGFDLAGRRESHWAWSPIRHPQPPVVEGSDWAQSPIDSFVLARQAEHGLKPASPADKRTLIRRASYDLIGLPPTQAEVEAFLADDSPRAFAKVVDRLLASKHFGERWGRHWMDLVRYSETLGHEFDYPIHNAWRYRDYIIRALNDDVPYHQLVKEHIAGDQLAKPRRDEEGLNQSVVATSFYWLAQQKHSPVDVKQEQVDLIDNQIDVISKTFLGLTVACARCHDHKFDAITTEDFYSLYGVLQSSRYSHTPIDDPAIYQEIKDQLAATRQQVLAAMGEQLKATAAEMPGYLLAAREVLTTKAEPGADPDYVVFEDFEDDLQGWQAEGEAFTLKPQTQETIGEYQGNVGAEGKGFINSHNTYREGKPVRSDKFTGSLTSPEFTLEQPYVHFLVGGGSHQGKTCVNLIVEGKVVRSATGKSNNRMEPARWDVREFAGKVAKIQVVDQVTGGWGNIGLDHIVFSSLPAHGFGGATVDTSLAQVARIATERGLDAELLQRWVAALQEPGAKHAAMWAWARVAGQEKPKLNATLTALKDRGAPEALREGDVTFVDFRKDSLAGWFRQGHAFPDRPTHDGELLIHEGKAQLVEGGWMRSDLLSRRLEGQLHSPTFTIEKPFLLMRVAGDKSRINIVVDNFTLIRNPIYGALKQNINQAEPHWVVVDVSMWQGHRCYLEFADNSARDPAGADFPAGGFIAVQRVLFSDHSSPPTQADWEPYPLAVDDVDSLESLAAAYAADADKALQQWQSGQSVDASLLTWLLERDLVGGKGELGQALAAHEAIRVPAPTLVAGITDGTPQDEYIFIRGSHKNLGQPADRDFLAALNDLHPEGFLRGSGRLELAECIVHPDNPLTTRVIANRIWHHLFGVGIVPSVDDFGVLGQRPSHPELLDWLATSFSRNGWSIKQLIREIMLSKTYQMSSRPSDEATELADPTNTWLHRARVRRLEGEVLRDAILATSGTLDTRMYGPSVDIHLTAFMEGRGRPGKSGPLDGDGRRSIYVEVRRNFLSPMMLAFDTPLPATTIGRRAVSNVPAQALILMNDPFVVQEARRWAERLVAREQSAEARVREIYQTALGRPPEAGELADAVAYVASRQGDAPVDVWADLCHVMFNVKEFFFIN